MKPTLPLPAEGKSISVPLEDLQQYMDAHGLRIREVTKDLVFILERKMESLLGSWMLWSLPCWLSWCAIKLKN